MPREAVRSPLQRYSKGIWMWFPATSSSWLYLSSSWTRWPQEGTAILNLCDSSFFFPVPALFLTNTCIILIKFETYFACCLIACGGTSCTILLLVVLCGNLVNADGSAGPVEGFLWLGMPSQGSRSDSWPRGAALVHGT